MVVSQRTNPENPSGGGGRGRVPDNVFSFFFQSSTYFTDGRTSLEKQLGSIASRGGGGVHTRVFK